MKPMVKVVRVFRSLLVFFASGFCVSGAEFVIGVNGRVLYPAVAVVRKGDGVRWSLTSPWSGSYGIQSYDSSWASPRLVYANGDTFFKVFDERGDHTYRVTDATRTSGDDFLVAGQILVLEDAPEVLIHSPIENQVLNSRYQEVYFSTSSTSAVERVEILVNDEKLTELVAPPFSKIAWTNPPVGVQSLVARFHYVDGRVAMSPPRRVEILSSDPFSSYLGAPKLLESGEFRMHYTVPFFPYLLEYSDDLKTWERARPIETMLPTGVRVDESATNSPARFYRIAYEPG